MKIYRLVESLPSFRNQLRYKLLDDAVDAMEIGQILPVEFDSIGDRRDAWNHLRYKYPDLILRQDGNFLYAEKGNFETDGK